MKKRTILFILGLVFTWTSKANAQRNFDNVQIKTHPVAKNIYMLEGSGGNIGVSAGEDGLLIIDDQFAPLAEKIREALREIDKGKIEFILNTHFHGDHTGGNAEFGKDGHIIAHDNVRARLLSGAPPMAKEGLPVITYAQSVSIHFNGEEIQAIHYPKGHTDGDSIIYFKGSNVVHMGDHFFNGMFPFIDLANGGTVQGYLENVAAVIAHAPKDAKFIPGHGPLATIDDLKTFHATLGETIDIVRKQMEGGKGSDAIVEAGLPEKFKSWGAGFVSTQRWIQTVFQSYSK